MVCAACGTWPTKIRRSSWAPLWYPTTDFECRRAIEPRKGFWTLPAGYMDRRNIEKGAREALEEAKAVIVIDGILGVFSIARLGQCSGDFRARFC